eukprot:Pgem_evm1s20005
MLSSIRQQQKQLPRLFWYCRRTKTTYTPKFIENKKELIKSDSLGLQLYSTFHNPISHHKNFLNKQYSTLDKSGVEKALNLYAGYHL